MPGRAFLDSNILIYAFSKSEPEKREIARNLWCRPGAWVSTQVINEVANVLIRKFRLPVSDASLVIDQIIQILPILTVDVEIIRKAFTIANRHPHSYFDALMLAAASHLRCHTLYSEDLHHDSLVFGVHVINPFLMDQST